MNIPEKSFFKIGEVAKLLDVEAYVLRYWESEFDMLVPEKTKSGQRIYQREDIELLAKIRTLLYVDMYTIVGARRQLELPVAETSAEVVPPQHGEETIANHEELIGLQNEYAALQKSYAELQNAQAELQKSRDELQSVHAELQSAHAELQNVYKTDHAERSASDTQLELAYENVCDERDVLTAQLEAVELENEALHLSLMPSESAAESEAKNSELFNVIAQLESELRDAHRAIDDLREFRKEQQSQEELRRRSALHAMRLELEGLADLANQTLAD